MFQLLFYLIPIIMLLFWVVSLCAYLIAKNENKKEPGKYSDNDMRIRKNILTVSSILAGILLVVVLGFAMLMFMAVAYM